MTSTPGPDRLSDAADDTADDTADGSADAAENAADERFAVAFEQAFQRVYLQFHRRDGKRSGLSAASRSVLTHLAHTGPLTVGEMSAHLDRAQSVVSDIVSGLEAKALLAREADPADRRRTLVWLTPEGFATLDTDRQVLSVDLVRRAAAALPANRRAALLDGLRALLDAPVEPPAPHTHPTHHTATTHPTHRTEPTHQDGEPR